MWLFPMMSYLSETLIPYLQYIFGIALTNFYSKTVPYRNLRQRRPSIRRNRTRKLVYDNHQSRVSVRNNSISVL